MKQLEHIIAHPTFLAPYIILQRTLQPNYQNRECKKCQKEFYVAQKDYVLGYYGATKQRLCPKCIKKITRTTAQKNIRKKKLRAASQSKHEGTHSTPKRQAMAHLDALLNFAGFMKASHDD